jgi:crossover junction endodeoxyribonuclease RuvC
LNSSIVLALDASLRNTGFVVGNGSNILKYGLFSTNPKHSLIKRLSDIGTFITSVVKEFNVAELAIEECFVGRLNKRTVVTLGKVHGAIFLTAVQLGLKIFEYGQSNIKKTVTGKGNNKKDQVAEKVVYIFGNDIIDLTPYKKTDDITDAFAVYYTHLQNKTMGANHEKKEV